MPPAISRVSFPGLHSIMDASITVTDGVQPSVALVTCASDGNQLPEDVGTLALSYDETGVSLILPDSAVRQAVESFGGAGDTITFQILDRRWKWRFALPLSGEYNRRQPDGTVVESSEKTPQELATLILDKLGETAYSVTDLPNDARPSVDWIDAPPASALSELLEDLGAVIVPQFDGSFAIRKKNVGEYPPRDPRQMTQGVDYQSPVRPLAILISGSLVKFQAKWKLRAVALDTDDKIKPLKDISYRPVDGFGDPESMELAIWRGLRGTDTEDPGGDATDALDRALRSVYKWFQVVELAEGGFDMGGKGYPITKLEQVLPLLPDLVDTETDPVTGEDTPKSPFVTGTYFTGSMDAVDAESAPVNVSFSLLGSKGIVVAAEPVVSIDDLAATDWEPDLRLTAAVNVVNDAGERLVTRRVGEDFERLGFGYLTVKKPELQLTRIHVYHDGDDNTDDVEGYTENDVAVDTEADVYITEAAAQFVGELGGSVSYAGLVPVQLDGAIRQVTYSVGPSGTRTVVSRNGQHDFAVPSDDEKREGSRREKFRRDAFNETIKGSFYGRRAPVYIQN